MNITLFNNCYPTEKYPNEGTYAQTIVEVLEESGAKVKICVMQRTGRKVIDYLRFYLFLVKEPLPKNTVLYINHYVFLLPLIIRLLFLHRRCIYHWHGEELIANGFVICCLRWLMIKTFRKDAIHISPSHYYIKIILEKLGVSNNQIVISPSGGVDTILFNGTSLPLAAKDILHIGYSAALSEHKGIYLLCDLLKHRKELESKMGRKVHFHVIEYGKDADIFKKFILENQINCITLYPKFEKSEIPSFYENIHLLLFLSKRESLGLTVLEAMACEVPILAKNICSMPEMVISGVTGELVNEYPSISEIIDKIVLIVDNFNNYQPRKFVQKYYNRERVTICYKKIISSL